MSSEGSGEPAHPRSLARTSAARSYKQSRGTFRQKARSLAPLNGWACAVKVCHDGMLEDTNSLDGAHIVLNFLHQYLRTQLFVTEFVYYFISVYDDSNVYNTHCLINCHFWWNHANWNSWIVVLCFVQIFSERKIPTSLIHLCLALANWLTYHVTKFPKYKLATFWKKMGTILFLHWICKEIKKKS